MPPARRAAVHRTVADAIEARRRAGDRHVHIAGQIEKLTYRSKQAMAVSEEQEE
jgi:hypothetical protein